MAQRNLIKIMKIIFIAVVIALADIPEAYSSLCPKLCTCSNTIINCKYGSMKTIPSRNTTATAILAISITNSDLTAIAAENFTMYPNIRVLKFERNTISRIEPNSFCNATKIYSLTLTYNFLQNLNKSSLACLVNLRFLRLGFNSIKTIPDALFSGLNSLELLVLFGNQIKEIRQNTFNYLTKLKYLDLAYNLIAYVATISFRHLNSLITLGLSENHLIEVDRNYFDLNPNLKSLYLGNNFLTKINPRTLCNLTALQNLFLEGNAMKMIQNETLNCLKNLRNLNLPLNSISHIQPNAFKGLDNLYSLDLSENFLLTIRASDFAGIPTLKILDLDHNHIRRIESGAFCGIPNVKTISLNGNNLNYISRKSLTCLAKVITLDLNINNIADIESRSFCSLPNLQYLELKRNNLTNINHGAMSCLTNLKTLDLSYNRIDYIASNSFSQALNLRKLFLTQNYLTEISSGMFADLKSLQSLKLDLNSITAIQSESFNGTTRLRSLYLQSNKLTDISTNAFHELKSLQTLDLTDNNITSLNPFQNLTSLMFLILDENEIEIVHNYILKNLRILQTLSLATNKIATVKSKAFSGLNQLKSLQLDGNPLQSIYELNLPEGIALKTLGLSNARIRKLKRHNFINSSVTIDILDFSNNLIQILPDFTFYYPQKLNLSYNQLYSQYHSNFSIQSSLTLLDLTGNKYEEIDGHLFISLKFPTKLQSLYLSANRLHAIHQETFSKIHQIRFLYINGNKLKDLRFIQLLPQLKILSLQNNEIYDLNKEDFANLTQLNELYLGKNKITRLTQNYFANTKLTSLSLENNLISVIKSEFTEILSLKSLNLNNNHLQAITELFKTELPALKYFYVRHNGITSFKDVNIWNVKALQVIDLYGNKIKYIENLRPLLLDKLNLGENRIQELSCSEFPSSILDLDLSRNNISKINPNCDVYLNVISELNLNYNDLTAHGINIQTEIVDKMSNVYSLKLAGNDITGLPKQNSKYFLANLDVSSNPLTLTNALELISKNTQQNLLHLNINNCNFSSIPKDTFRPFPNLKTLFMNNNNIRSLDLSDLARNVGLLLTELQIAGNKIPNLTFSSKIQFESIISLNISSNKLSTICHQNLGIYFPYLVKLDIRYNTIDSVTPRCFRGLLRLKESYMQGNHLAYITSKSFFGPPNLNTILTGRDYLCCMVPAKVKTCIPTMNSETLSSCQQLLAHSSLQAFIWIIGSLALIGNLIVLIQNYSQKRQSRNHIAIYLVNNLAISDLLMGFYLLIIAIADIVLSVKIYGPISESWLLHPLCYLACSLVIASSYTSVLIMVIITVDRYISIVTPFSNRQFTMKLAYTLMTAVWCIGIIFSILPTWFSVQQPGYLRIYTYNSMCMPNNYENIYYMIWMIWYLLITFIAWIIMIALYSRIYASVRSSAKRVQRSSTRENKILAIRLSFILLSDLLCWLPYYYVNLAGLIEIGRVDVITLQFIGIFTLPINSAVNPFLYTLTNVDNLKRIFCVGHNRVHTLR